MRKIKLSRLLNISINQICFNPDVSRAIELTLSYIGENTAADRVFVVVKKIGGAFSVAYEWRSYGTPSIKELFKNFQIDDMIPHWSDTIKTGGFITVPNTINLNKTTQEIATKLDIKAFSHYPMWSNGELRGYVGIHYCHNAYYFNEEESHTLYSLSGLISMALARLRLEDEFDKEGKIRSDILNSIDIAVYITDLETNRILFANKNFMCLYEEMQVIGGLCWNTIFKLDSRCPFCPIPYLLKNPGKNFSWEAELVGKSFRIQNSLILWTGGKSAHLAGLHEL